MTYLIRILFLSVAVMLFSTAALPVHAQSSPVSVLPAVINEKAKARDIVTKTITVTNTSDRTLKLYPSVNNVDPNNGEVEFEVARGGDDLTASLANWIELSRGVIEIRPGEERAIPFVIRVNLNATPGMYHANISFSEGSTRSEAEARGQLASVMVNLEVLADIKEILQLNRFFTDNMFFSGDDVLFNYHIENAGNQDLQPKGEIRIYNRKGGEVAAVDVNKDGKSFAPDQIGQLASVWSAVDGFGRFKAHLNLEYGSSQSASVQDTVFFWIIPLKQILGLFAVSLAGIVFSAFSFHKWLDRRHRLAFAVAAAPQGTMEPPAAMLPPEPHDLLPPHQEHAEPEMPSKEGEDEAVPDAGGKTAKAKRSWFPFSWSRTTTSNTVTAAQDEQEHDEEVPATEGSRAPVTPSAASGHEVARQKAATLREAIPNNRASAGARECGDTIDLKKFCKPDGSGGVIEHHHVVDLKKRRT